MPAKRRTASNRRRVKTKPSGGVPAWFWLLGGVAIGLGIALLLMLRGYLPELQQHMPSLDGKDPATTESALIEDSDTRPAEPEKPRYDFFTVLPEMEVVVPEQELSRKAEPSATLALSDSVDSYVLQAGSFKNAADAEQMKARLALLGSMATVQTVTVNGQTWHRVRIGPVAGARKADELRRMLADNQIETLVMKANP